MVITIVENMTFTMAVTIAVIMAVPLPAVTLQSHKSHNESHHGNHYGSHDGKSVFDMWGIANIGQYLDVCSLDRAPSIILSLDTPRDAATWTLPTRTV